MHYTTYWGVKKDRGLPKDPNWIQAIRVEPSDIRMEDWSRYAGSPGYWTRNQIVVNVKIIWTNPDKDTRWAGRTHCLPQTFGSKTDWEALRFPRHEMRLPDAFRFIRSAIGESQFEDYKVSARILPFPEPPWCDRFFEDELPMDIVTNTVTMGLKNQGVINVFTKLPTGDQIRSVLERVKYYKEPYIRNS
jgi:hypothetical protein